MGQDYYGDVLDSSDKQMDYDHEDSFKMDPLKEITFKVKHAPSKSTSMSNGADMVKGKTAGAWDFKHKSEIKQKCCHQLTSTVVASNKDFTVRTEWAPKDLNKDGLNSSIEVEGKCTPAKEDWEGHVNFKIGGFELGPIKPWTEINFETNKSKTHTLSFAQNLCYQSDFNLAWKTCLDINSKKLTDAHGVFALNNHHGNWYVRANLLNRFVGVGFHDKICDKLSVGTEIQYDLLNKNKGIMGNPLFWRFGGVFTHNNGVRQAFHGNFGQRFWLTSKATVKVNDQTNVTISERMDVKNLASPNFTLGLGLEFKM